ncbi:transposase, partial [Streptomyces sp. NPDC057428]|uniref:transposase n=1 Tax=Streptomyces sp. NPDC057428 TaxID=3346129 RepID=UPI00369DC78A
MRLRQCGDNHRCLGIECIERVGHFGRCPPGVKARRGGQFGDRSIQSAWRGEQVGFGLPVVADAGYGDATGFREGLTERGLTYAVAV